MSKKYELTDGIVMSGSTKIYRIVALRDFSNVKAGDFGGYIASEDNLSHDGNCWVYDNAVVYGNAKVHENASIYDRAQIYGDSHIYEKARIFGQARVFGVARICGEACICGNSIVHDNVEISAECYIHDSHIFGDTRMGSRLIYIITHIELNHGIWNKTVKVNDIRYLISTALEKIPVSNHIKNKVGCNMLCYCTS